MRQDQYEKLQVLAEKLTDTFIIEANPDTWPGAGVDIATMDQQTRGDRYWVKKNAAATLSVITRTIGLVGIIQQRAAGGADVPTPAEGSPEDDSLDADIKAAEKEAKKLLDQYQRGNSTAKEAFDKRVHGKV